MASRIVSFIVILSREIWQNMNVTWLDGGDKVKFGQKNETYVYFTYEINVTTFEYYFPFLNLEIM